MIAAKGFDLHNPAGANEGSCVRRVALLHHFSEHLCARRVRELLQLINGCLCIKCPRIHADKQRALRALYIFKISHNHNRILSRSLGYLQRLFPARKKNARLNKSTFSSNGNLFPMIFRLVRPVICIISHFVFLCNNV